MIKQTNLDYLVGKHIQVACNCCLCVGYGVEQDGANDYVVIYYKTYNSDFIMCTALSNVTYTGE